MQQRRAAAATRSPPLCLHYLRGSCGFGAACRYSHDTQERIDAALPFAHRQYVEASHHAGLATSKAKQPWKLRILSYNVLADSLARDHAAELYSSTPRFSLEWGFRSSLLVREILHHQPDIVCLQEVDHFRHFEEALKPHGYAGTYTQRTGDRRDGLAMFWRTSTMHPVNKRIIKFSDLGLKDNVAQVLVFEQQSSSGKRASSSSRRSEGSAHQQDESPPSLSRHLRFASGSESEDEDHVPVQCAEQSGSMQTEDITQQAADEETTLRTDPREGPPTLLCANIHVLFNPKRGDIKLGQVRTLMENVHSMCLQQRKKNAQHAAVICGDFNSAAGSPIYQFVRNGQLNLHEHDRRRLSGQVERALPTWRALQQSFLQQQQEEQFAAQSFSCTSHQLPDGHVVQQWAGLEELVASTSGPGQQASASSSRAPRPWSAEDVRIAAGSAHASLQARHPLQLESAYLAVTGSEAAFTTCHDRFIGCVDYIWFTPGGQQETAGGGRLVPLAVLAPPPLDTLRCALPSPAWPSDHISLVADFALF